MRLRALIGFLAAAAASGGVCLGSCGTGGAEATSRDTGSVARGLVPEERSQHGGRGDSTPESIRDAAIWSTTSGGYDVAWTPADITISRSTDRAVVLSLRSRLDSAIGTDVVPVADDDTTGWICQDESDLRVLSVVGPIMSIEQRAYLSCKGAAHPSVSTTWVAIDLSRTEREGPGRVDGAGSLGREVALTDLFPDADVLAALLGDRLVQRRIEEIRVKTIRPTTTAELVALLEGGERCEYRFEPDMLFRFAFHHIEGDRVAVRIGLSHGCEAARGTLTQIGLLLKIPPALRAELEAAAAGTHGILARDAMARFATTAMHTSHRYRVDDSDSGGE